MCAVLEKNISKRHNSRGSPSPLLKLERNPEFTTATLKEHEPLWQLERDPEFTVTTRKDPEPPTATREEAPPELESNSESPASTQQEFS